MNKILELLKRLGAKDDEIAEAQAEIESEKESEVKGLKAKRDELLAENRKLKNTGNDDAAKLADENAQLRDQLEANGKAMKQLEAKVKQLENDKAQVEKDFSTKLSSEQAAINRLLIEDGLTKGITQLGITAAPQVAAVRALLKEKGVLSVKAEGDIRKAIAKIVKDGKESELELDAYLKDWASSDEGKAFVPAAQNKGSGAGGGSGNRAPQDGGPNLGTTVLESLKNLRS